MGDQYEQIYENYKAQNPPSEEANHAEAANTGEQVVAVRKNDDGNIIAIRTDKGRELDYVSALAEAKASHLSHVDIFHKYGRDILRSEPDGIKENNLDNLPQF